MRRLLIIGRFLPIVFFILFSKELLALGAAEPITAADAYLALERKGKLESVKIIDEFDIAKIIAPPFVENAVSFTNVTFEKELSLAVETIHINISFQNCNFNDVKIARVRWLGSMQFIQCEFSGAVKFLKNEFQSDFICHESTFYHWTSFKSSRFKGNTEFIDCEFIGLRTIFSNTLFLKPAIFNFSKFSKNFSMKYAVFRDDVNFLKCEIGEARFENSMFHGDAEFRYCAIKSGMFSSPVGITVFFGAADFRKSKMEKAVFDYAEFRGAAYFIQAKFGTGGVSFANTNFSGPIVNLDAVESKGPVKLEGAYMQHLMFHWKDIRKAILAGTPSSKVLGNLQNHLNRLDQPDEARRVYAHFRAKKIKEHLKDEEFEFLEKLWLVMESFFWGLPTGFGTKIGRITLICIIAMCICVIPVALKKGIIAEVPFEKSNSQNYPKIVSRKKFIPTYINELQSGARCPLSLTERIYKSWSFVFALMFKFRLHNIYYVEHQRIDGRHAFEKYFISIWLLGSVLLALLGLTLANTSPIMKKLIGEILL